MPERRLKRGLRATFTGLAVNTVLAASKLAAGLLGHSHALTADAVESLTDVFSSLVVWRALVVAAEPADEDHPYGHGKAEPIAAATVSALLLVAAVWICIRSAQEAFRPHPAPAPFTLGVLGVAVGIKELMFRFIRRVSVAVESTALRADAWHHRSDATTSLAAALGIGIALIGGRRYAITDDLAAVLAALIIAWNGSWLLRNALSELMDRSPSRDLLARLRQVGESVSGVVCVEKCLARKMGYQFYVDMHVQVDPQMTVARAHEIAHDVKDRVRQRMPAVRDVLVHIEPAGQGMPGPPRA
jgi:cation diffusion facilitator family transporter